MHSVAHDQGFGLPELQPALEDLALAYGEMSQPLNHRAAKYPILHDLSPDPIFGSDKYPCLWQKAPRCRAKKSGRHRTPASHKIELAALQ